MNTPRGKGAALGLMFALAGCATHKETAREELTVEQQKAFGEQAHRAVLEATRREIQQHQNAGRLPASAADAKKELGVDFGSLRGSFRMTVFPKVNTMSEKSSEESVKDFGRPITYQVSVPRNLKCKQLAADPAKDWNQREYFRGNLGDRSCAILKIKRVDPAMNFASLKLNDITEARLYVDSDYRGYGMDVDTYAGRRALRQGETPTRKVFLDPRDALSSGLLLFPIDVSLRNDAPANGGPITFTQDRYVMNKLKKRTVVGCPSAKSTEFVDDLGRRSKLNWCPGYAWPVAIENSNYYAVMTK